MDTDPIVEEVRAVRDEFAREHDYDIDAMVRALQQESASQGRRLVRLAPRPVDDDGILESLPDRTSSTTT
jgi:hypothetical protein